MPGTRQNAAAFCIVLLTAATLLAGCRQPNDREVQALEADVHTLAREDRIYWLQQHTNSANPAFTFLLGKTLLEDYHLADGFKLIEASLAPGFEPGLHYAAKMLATGDGIVPNATRAAAYYDAAAKLGNPVTQYEAAIYRALGPTNINDPAKAIHWFTLAANQGHAESCYQLGRTYHQGRYLPKNEARANYYLKKSRRQRACRSTIRTRPRALPAKANQQHRRHRLVCQSGCQRKPAGQSGAGRARQTKRHKNPTRWSPRHQLTAIKVPRPKGTGI
jgi:hypothetical protein